jgi:hypothetical protein
MPEAGHESVEEDRRGSFSEGLFRVHLRRLQLESSRRSLTLLQSASELADKTNCQHDGRESTKSRSPRPAARKCAPRVISNAKERSRCLAIVTLVRPIASPSIISSERGRRAFGRACYRLRVHDRREYPGGSLCRIWKRRSTLRRFTVF